MSSPIDEPNKKQLSEHQKETIRQFNDSAKLYVFHSTLRHCVTS